MSQVPPTRRRWYQFGIGTMLVLALMVAYMLTMVIGHARSTPEPLPSPDGSMALLTSVEQSRADPKSYLCVIFEIRDQNGKVLHRENTGASDASRWQMNWESNDTIGLQSSDIGTRHWQKQPDGAWKKE